MDPNYGKLMEDIRTAVDAKDSSISESLEEDLQDSFDDEFYGESGDETLKKPKRQADLFSDDAQAVPMTEPADDKALNDTDFKPVHEVSPEPIEDEFKPMGISPIKPGTDIRMEGGGLADSEPKKPQQTQSRVTQKPKVSNDGLKKAVQDQADSQKKSVKFKDQAEMPAAIHRPQSAKKKGKSPDTTASPKPTAKAAGDGQGAQRGPAQRQGASEVLLVQLQAEIWQHHKQNNVTERNRFLRDYCRIANEATQGMDLKAAEGSKAAVAILDRCTEQLEKYATKQNTLSDMFYETYNNIARCHNNDGNIPESLNYLLKAMDHVKLLAMDQEQGSVTIVPELSLNICNAYIYLGHFQQALEYAELAIQSSQDCIQSLVKKLEQPSGSPGDSSQGKAEKERLYQFYMSQINLHVQGFQAKASTFEKLNAFKDAIREYNQAKAFVERYLGTDHPLFKELVSQITTANVAVKSKTYTAKQDTATGLASSSGSKSKKGGQLSKTHVDPPAKGKSFMLTEGEVVQSGDDQIDIRSFGGDSQGGRSAFTDKDSTFERRNGSTRGSGVPRSAQNDSSWKKKAAQSKQTESQRCHGRSTGSILKASRPGSAVRKSDNRIQAKGQNGRNTNFDKQSLNTDARNESDREEFARNDTRGVLQSAGRRLKKGAMVDSMSTGSQRVAAGGRRRLARPASARPLQRIAQPPMYAGGPNNSTLGHSRIGHIQNALRNGQSWKFDQYLTSNMLGLLSMPRFAYNRPFRHYPTKVHVIEGKNVRQRSQSASKKVSTRTPKVKAARPQQSEESSSDTLLFSELKRMRESIKERDRLGMEDKIRQVQQAQQDHNRSILMALDQQKNQFMESQARQRDAMRMERLSLQSQKTQDCSVCDAHSGCPMCSLHGAMPYPLPVYPYPPPAQAEPAPRAPSPKKSPPKMRDSSQQKDFDVAPRPPTRSFEVQTIAEPAQLSETAIQTQALQSNEMGTSPIKMSPPKKAPPPPKPKGRYTEDEAAAIITRQCRQKVMRNREQEYLNIEGVIYTRKRVYNQQTGGMQIMSMYMVHDTENRCVCIRFTIFDYATKKFVYLGIYEKLEHLHDFDVIILKTLAKASLDEIPFEREPFKMHILCLKSIVDTYRVVQKPQKEIRLPPEIEPAPKREPRLPKQAEIKYVDEPKAQMVEAATQMEHADEYVFRDTLAEPGPERFPGEPMSLNELRERRRRQALIISRRVIYIQKRLRGFLARIRYKRLVKRQVELLYRSTKRVEVSRRAGVQYFRVELNKQPEHTDGDGAPSNWYYTLVAKQAKKGRDMDEQAMAYQNIRLPEDPAILRYYMDQATVLTVDRKTGKIDSLKLLRLKVKLFTEFQLENIKHVPADVVQMDKIGCNLRLEFDLQRYPDTLCKVYKRVRWADGTRARKVEDWKIKVIQKTGAKDMDYLVVKKLPCKLDSVEKDLQANLDIQHNKRILPKVFLHMYWRVRGLRVYSQRYYDLSSLRYDALHHATYYFSQNMETGQRVLSKQQIAQGKWDPFYEVYVQKLVPKFTTCKPYDYRVKGPRRGGQQRQMMRNNQGKAGGADAEDSGSEDRSANRRSVTKRSGASECDGDDDTWWDEQELENMQLDEYTIKRHYIKVTCLRTVDKQDQDYFIIEADIAKWCDPSVEYQYLMENLVLRQAINPATGETNVDMVGLKIRNQESRFTSETIWVSYLRGSEIQEVYMAQDVQRWKNQRIACTVYSTKADQGGAYLVEAVHIDKPKERAYLNLGTMRGMRGEILKYYVDASLKLYSVQDIEKNRKLKNANIDQSSGFANEVIHQIDFAISAEGFRRRMDADASYADWEYEDVPDEDSRPKSPATLKRLEEEARREQERTLEEKKRKEEVEMVERYYREQALRGRDDEMKKQRENMKAKRGKAGSKTQEEEAAPVASYKPKEELKSEQIAQISYDLDITDRESVTTKTVTIHVKVHKFFPHNHYQFEIINGSNPTQDDTIWLKSSQLPNNVQEYQIKTEKLRTAFQQKLKIIWRPFSEMRENIFRMQDAFIDHTFVREEVIHKIVEVKQWDDDLYDMWLREWKKKRKEKKAGKEKKRKKSRSSSSETEDLGVDAEELLLIKQDVKTIRDVTRRVRRKIAAMDRGVQGIDEWFKYFDHDGSREIELDEFIKMMQHLNIVLEDRIGIMLFRVFDRADQGCFGRVEFRDVINKRMIPNWKKIVCAERERFRRFGLDLKWPNRKPKEPKVVYKPKIVEKVVTVEKPVIQEKIVERVVEKVVEKPYYVEVHRDQPSPEPKPQPPQPEPVEVPKTAHERSHQPTPQVQPPPSAPATAPNQYTRMPNGLALHKTEVFAIQQFGVTIIYKIFSGKQKDYYFSLETEASGQKFGLFQYEMFADQGYEEEARRVLRARRVTNPTPGALAGAINDMFRPEIESLCLKVLTEVMGAKAARRPGGMSRAPEMLPEDWLEPLKQKIRARFIQEPEAYSEEDYY